MVERHQRLEAEIGGYEAAEQAQEEIARIYASIATLLRCSQEEVALVENATRAWDMAFYAIPFQPGDRILTGETEYASNRIAFLHMANRTGVSIETVPNDTYGQISVEALRKAIDARVKLVALTHVPNYNGLVQPAAEVGKVAREAGVLYLLDACQSVGQMPIDVQEIGCDMLSVTGRKYLRGPRGTGFLYVRHEVMKRLDPPFLELQSADWVAPDRYVMRPDAHRFETWEANIAARLGLGAAVDYALQWGLDAIQARVAKLAESLRIRLSELSGVTIHDSGPVRSGIVTFSVSEFASEEVRDRLRNRRIHLSVVSLPPHARAEETQANSSRLRASVHYYNSKEEVETFCRAISEIIKTR
jgi:selenocysteine lyase/cysteine desulfurase